MPCRGCFGPLDGVVDQGVKGLSAIVSILGIEGEDRMAEEDTHKLVSQIVDPAGTFYRFSLPASLLRRKRVEGIGE
jgi:F420-non-reducing hydrogenase small subunit